MIHHLIGAGAFRVGVGHHIVREQVIFQIGIRHGLRIQRLHIFRFGKSVVPAGLGVRVVRRRHIAVFRHIFAQFRHQIVAVEILNRSPPAEVVEAVVAHAHLFTVFEADNLRHPPFNADRHIADVEDFGVRTQTAGGFRHNRRRVGVVQHPGVRRIFFHIIHQLQHAADRAHTVGDPARSAGLLAQHAVAQRDFLILFTHRIFPDADMRHDEINIGKRRLRIGGIAEFNLRRLLFEDHFARLGDGLLARTVVVVKFQRPQRKTILVCQQHQDNARSEGAAAACDNN